MTKAALLSLICILVITVQICEVQSMTRSTLGVPQQIPGTLRTITCLAENQYDMGLPIICGQYSLYFYDLRHVVNPESVHDDGLTSIAGEYGISGYKEGLGIEARFTDIQEVVQLNHSVMLVSDHQNHCLRIIVGSLTAPYAGKCRQPGFLNGDFKTARFHSPSGFVKIDKYLYLSDMGNNALRIVDLDDNYVSTFLKGPHIEPIYQPLYISCGPSCNSLYVSMLYGVAKVDRVTKRTTVISGAVNQYGKSVGSLDSTRFMWPEKLALLSPNEIIVADRDAARLVLLNLETQQSEGIGISAFPWPILKLDSLLLIGTNQSGLFISNIKTKSMPGTMSFQHFEV